MKYQHEIEIIWDEEDIFKCSRNCPGMLIISGHLDRDDDIYCQHFLSNDWGDHRNDDCVRKTGHKRSYWD